MKLDEIEKLCNEATPGPWELVRSRIMYKLEPDVITSVCFFAEDGMRISSSVEMDKVNGKFIAASRDLIPKLLKVAKAAKVINDAMIREQQYIYGAEILDEALNELEKE